MFHYSPSAGGFYATEINGASLPDDAVEIPETLYRQLRRGLGQGSVIAMVNGLPSLASPPTVTDTARRTAWRRSASLSRSQFCLALKRAAILTPADAIEAAKGEWPASFAAALESMPEAVDPEEAQIIWGATSTVSRTDPVLLAMQSHRGMTDDEVDALFGYTA